jgi:hypothetical protein
MKKDKEKKAQKVDFGSIDLPKLDLTGFNIPKKKATRAPEEEQTDRAMPTRYTPPLPPITGIHVLYKNAAKMAHDLKVGNGERYNAIVSGDFVFGDFIGAYIWEHKLHVEKMLISTLSVNQKNVEMLARLMEKGFIQQLDMLLSIYFYGNEKFQLIPFIRRKLDVENRFQLAIAGIHTKIVQFKTSEGQKIVVSGSANLRSSGNVEQFTIEDNPVLYDFYEECFTKVMERFGTIQKDIRHHQLWDVISKQKFND